MIAVTFEIIFKLKYILWFDGQLKLTDYSKQLDKI